MNAICGGCSHAHQAACIKFSNTDIIALVAGAALLAVSTYFMMNATLTPTLQILTLGGIVIGGGSILYSLIATVLKSCDCLPKKELVETNPLYKMDSESDDEDFEFSEL